MSLTPTTPESAEHGLVNSLRHRHHDPTATTPPKRGYRDVPEQRPVGDELRRAESRQRAGHAGRAILISAGRRAT